MSRGCLRLWFNPNKLKLNEMTKENKDKIIDRVIDFLHNKPLKSDMRIAASLIEELKLVKNCSIPDVRWLVRFNNEN